MCLIDPIFSIENDISLTDIFHLQEARQKLAAREARRQFCWWGPVVNEIYRSKKYHFRLKKIGSIKYISFSIEKSIFNVFICETGSGYEIYVKKWSGTNIELSEMTISMKIYIFWIDLFHFLVDLSHFSCNPMNFLSYFMIVPLFF